MKRKIFKILIILLVFLLIGLPCIDLIMVKLKTRHLVEKLLNSEKCLLEIKAIDQKRINDLLLVEDPTFFEHKGLDFKSPGAGWTTISQGLVKLFYFKKFHPGFSKIRLMLITRFVFDPSVSKENQLKLFYNYAYLGNDTDGKTISGFSRASGFYFQKGFNELTNDEYLSLVAMLINPTRYRIDKFPDKNSERVERINRFINGECKPANWKDCELNGCK